MASAGPLDQHDGVLLDYSSAGSRNSFGRQCRNLERPSLVTMNVAHGPLWAGPEAAFRWLLLPRLQSAKYHESAGARGSGASRHELACPRSIWLTEVTP